MASLQSCLHQVFFLHELSSVHQPDRSRCGCSFSIQGYRVGRLSTSCSAPRRLGYHGGGCRGPFRHNTCQGEHQRAWKQISLPVICLEFAGPSRSCSNRRSSLLYRSLSFTCAGGRWRRMARGGAGWRTLRRRRVCTAPATSSPAVVRLEAWQLWRR